MLKTFTPTESFELNKILYEPDNVRMLRLMDKTNIDMLNEFERVFNVLDNYKPTEPADKDNVLRVSGMYVEEMMVRIGRFQKKNDLASVVEIAKIIQRKLKTTKKEGFYLNNILRLYSVLIRVLDKMGYHLIKKEFK